MRTMFIGWLSVVLFLAISACAVSTPTAIPSNDTKILETPTRKSKPTATEKPAVPTPTIVQYPHNEKALVLIPTIVISAAKDDPRIPLVQEAVDYWNQQFQQIGTPFHLGAVTQTIDLIPETDYEPLTKAGLAQVDKLPGNILIVLSTDRKFISFTHAMGTKRLIAIQGNPGGRNSLPIDLDVIAHEMGHAIGLGHNNAPGALMCGGPTSAADCESFSGAWLAEGPFAPLTDAEIAYLKQIYPPTWKPTQ